MMAAQRWNKGVKHPVTGESVGGRFMTVEMREQYNPDGSLKAKGWSTFKSKSPVKITSVKAKVVDKKPKPKKAKRKSRKVPPKPVPLPAHKMPPIERRNAITGMFYEMRAVRKPLHKYNIAFSAAQHGVETRVSGSSLVVSYDLCYLHEAVIRGTLMMAAAKVTGIDAAQLFPGQTIIIADGVAYCGPGSPL